MEGMTWEWATPDDWTRGHAVGMMRSSRVDQRQARTEERTVPDPVTVSSIFASLKAATEIAKLLKDTGIALEKAELKNRLADLLNSLADAKLELAEVRDEMLEKDARISELQGAFEVKDSLVRWGDGLYLADDGGKPKGDAFCLRCWEAEHKTRQLVLSSVNPHHRICPSCKSHYNGRLTISDPK